MKLFGRMRCCFCIRGWQPCYRLISAEAAVGCLTSNKPLFVCLFCWCLTALSAHIGYIMPQAYEIYIV